MILIPLHKEETNTKTQKCIFLLAYISYIVLGAMIFRALEKDFEVELQQLAVHTKTDFLRNRSNMTQKDVELFVQVRHEHTVIFRVIGCHLCRRAINMKILWNNFLPWVFCQASILLVFAPRLWIGFHFIHGFFWSKFYCFF